MELKVTKLTTSVPTASASSARSPTAPNKKFNAASQLVSPLFFISHWPRYNAGAEEKDELLMWGKINLSAHRFHLAIDALQQALKCK